MGMEMTAEAPSLLPPECKSHILSFLNLDHVLLFAQTCKTAMNDVLLELYHRRQSMMMTTTTTRKCPSWNNMERIMIPSLYDRICQLCKHFPSGHPMAKTVCQLKEDLEQDIRLDGGTVTHVGLSFSNLFSLYHRLLSAPRLYATIWHHVMMHSNPPKAEDHDDLTTVNLDRYVGDVLCVAHLVFDVYRSTSSHDGPANRSLGDGGTIDYYCNKTVDIPQQRCYLFWVFLHGSILRAKSFSAAQRDRLGISEFLAAPAAATSKSLFESIHHVDDRFLDSEMTLVFREFGPLGPAFRGRDIVRLRDIPARGLVAYYMTTTSNGNWPEGMQDTVENA